MQCSHRARGPWAKLWDVWLGGVLGSLIGFEIAALVTDGPSGMLTAHIRMRAGLEPECKHASLGRACILAAFGWAGIHLGWGVLGWSGRRR